MSEPDTEPTFPLAFLVLLVCAAAFVWWSSRQLPELVASHFDSAGRVNGHMPRAAYLALMLAITVVVPLMLVVIPRAAFTRPGARINLPNREYWLAPERRAATIRFLARQTSAFAWIVVLFLCYVQWLVVRANSLTPPALNSRALTSALVVFLVSTLGWIVWLIGRFR